jgi:hypothetical protein
MARAGFGPFAWVARLLDRGGVYQECGLGHLHGRSPKSPSGDVDVLWFDPGRADASGDRRWEATLRSLEPGLDWSVKNQARMHARNGDAPYASAVDAMRYWPETATAVAVRLTGPSRCEIAAPFGLDDLFALVLRPTPRFSHARHADYLERVHAKGWLAAWPGLRMESGPRS